MGGWESCSCNCTIQKLVNSDQTLLYSFLVDSANEESTNRVTIFVKLATLVVKGFWWVASLPGASMFEIWRLVSGKEHHCKY